MPTSADRRARSDQDAALRHPPRQAPMATPDASSRMTSFTIRP